METAPIVEAVQGAVKSAVYMLLVLASSTEPAHHEEARELALQTLETEKMNVMRLGLAHVALAMLAASQARPAEAEAEARKASELLAMFAPYRLMARSTLSAALLAQKRVEEAPAVAEDAVRTLEQLGGSGAMSVGTWLSLAEACLAQQDTAAGEHALREALRCMRLRAEEIPETAARECFLRQVPENSRARQLARAQWGDGWDTKPSQS